MSKITFDTNIFVSRPRVQLPENFYLHAVVLQELVAGAADDTELKAWSVVRSRYHKIGRLLVPTEEDWWQVGRILNALQRGLKSQSGGETPRMMATEKYRLTHDILIARTAKRAGVTIVTDNRKDFDKIQKFCNVRYVSGDEFFA